nr:hypothetical protein BaRGS_016839 [Batillaria attramentaria]
MQQRRDHIDEIEYGLLQHPLALYPHLEESVPPEMFEDIVDILDPEMNMMDDDDLAEEDEDEAGQAEAAPQDAQPPVSSRTEAESERAEG